MEPIHGRLGSFRRAAGPCSKPDAPYYSVEGNEHSCPSLFFAVVAFFRFQGVLGTYIIILVHSTTSLADVPRIVMDMDEIRVGAASFPPKRASG